MLKLIKKYRKIFWQKKKFLLLHSAVALTFTSGLSYVFGFLRDRLLAQTFGVGRDLDVYYAAFVLPDILLAIFVTSCVSAVLVPIFTSKLKKNKKEAQKYFYNILFIILILIIGLAVIIGIFIPWWTTYLVPGFTLEQKELYVLVVRIMLLSPIIFAVSNFFGGALIATKDLFFYGIAPAFYNLGIIVGTIILTPRYGIVGVAMGTILGAFLHLISRLIVGLKRVGFKLVRQEIWRWDETTKKTFLLMLPKVLQIGAWQGLLAWFVFLASYFEEGDITVYSLARNFQSMPVSLIGISIAVSTFATLSHLGTEEKWLEFKKVVRKKMQLILFLTVSSAILLVLGGRFLVTILFVGKSFEITAVNRVVGLLAIYTISIPLESMMHLLTRAHYALQETLRPSLIHILTIGITIGIGWLGRGYGIYIIPISFAIGLVIQNILLLIFLIKNKNLSEGLFGLK